MMSNYNVALFFLLGCIGAMAITIPIRLWRKKNVTQ
jgi:formate-dependent nitrite reductase membrane component NrfD